MAFLTTANRTPTLAWLLLPLLRRRYPKRLFRERTEYELIRRHTDAQQLKQMTRGQQMATNQNSGNQGNTSNRGFASMDEDKQREIASKGGKAAHEKGNAHEFSSQEAREAGRKSSGGTHEQHVEAGRQSHKND